MATAIMTDLGGIPTFDCHGDQTTVGVRWTKWRRAFELFIAGKGVKDAAQKKALLLHCGGMEMQDIFFTFTLEDPGENQTVYDVAMKKLDDHFKPQVNDAYERHLFRAMKQSQNETIDQFVTRLRQKAEFCGYGTKTDESIRDQVIEKCSSSVLRRKLLERGKDLTLEKLQTIARALEASETQAFTMENIKSEVNHVQVKGSRSCKASVTKKPSSDKRCYRCDREGHNQSSDRCPAKGKECHKCGRTGHFAKCCKSGTVNKPTKGRSRDHNQRNSHVRFVDTAGNQEDDHDDEYAFSVTEFSKQPSITVQLGGVSAEMIIDSGASCNVIDKSTWEILKNKRIQCQSQRSSKRLFSYGSQTPMNVIGTFLATISVGSKSEEAEFIVVEEKGQALLGRETALKLGVLKLGPDVQVNTVSDSIFTEYSDVFQGLGKLKDFQLEIPIDKEVTPVAQPLRRAPFNLRSLIEKKLDELENLDVIEKASGPTPWISPVVVVPKKNDIRLCIDMRQANSAIIRERHPIPTVDEVLHVLNQSTIFSKLDIKWAFHQVELCKESRPITTFVTHKGLYRYKRLMFGISCAPEMYQRVIQQALEGCEGVRNIFDDIVVHGTSVEEHDARLRKLLDRIREKGLTLNKEKCKFRMSEIVFMGHLLSARGIGPAKSKVTAVNDARQPETASEIRGFLGLVNYSSRFIPDLATLSEPLRRLTRKGVHFNWGQEQEHAFEELKRRLTNAQTLGYYDPKAETIVITDASPVGLGAVLVQKQNGDERVICYASRTLSDVEKRYSQTEKEALGIVWACERFHMYLYGTEFELRTDHKPLEFIYSKKSKPCARIERWVLRLQTYTFKVKHIPGKQNIADCLSRMPSKEVDPFFVEDSETHVKFVAETSTPNAMSTRQIERESDKDPELVDVRECIQTGKWHNIQEKLYLTVREELCCIGKLILRGTRIVIPTELRTHVLELAHEGHPGIVVMKRRLRAKVWWPGIDREVEKFVKTCHSCQLVSQPQAPEPIKTTELPNGPWQHIAVDLMTPSLPSGDHLFVAVDYYSRYIEVEHMKSTTTDKIIRSLKRMFLTHGLPLSISSDNGPQFISHEFKEFMTENDIYHRKTTPLWPQANGEIERQNRSLLKRIKIAQIEKKDWKEELSSYLMMYRTTPHSITGVSPSELLFRRKIRTRLPGIEDYSTMTDDQDVRDRDSEKKEKGKMYIDNKRGAKESDIAVGDSVLLKQKPGNKLTPTFEAEPYHVTEKTGNSVTVESPSGVCYKRNTTHLKKFHERANTFTKSTVDDKIDGKRIETNIPNCETATRICDTSAYTTRPTEVRDTSVQITRPIRERKLPDRLKEYEVSFQ